MPPKLHSLSLTIGAVALLKHIIAQPGWAETPADTFRAGQIGEDVLPSKLDAAPNDPEAQKQFYAQPHAIEVTEKQRETMKRCVEAHCKKGAFVPSRPVMCLLTELGLAPEE